MRPLVAILSASLIGLWTAAPRTIVVTGKVTSAVTGAPIEGASVIVADRNRSAATNRAGVYTMQITTDDTATVGIRFRAIGYQPHSETKRIGVAGQDTIVVNAVLSPDVNRLSEVIVTSMAGRGVQYAKVPFAIARLGSSGMARGAGAKATKANPDTGWSTEEYGLIEENPFLSVSGNALSTFSADVDRASYANVRRFINQNRLPPNGAVRIEELVNYFRYDYEAPRGEAPIAIHSEVVAAPWRPEHRIVRLGLQAKRVDTDKLPPANLVFLIDVSGSMMDQQKLPLVKQGFQLLVDQLREQDRVAIVVYAGAAGLVLPSTPATDKQRIRSAIDQLEAGGSTAGGAGIRLAYQVAKENFRKDANNRVILATDGDFNVGVSNTQELVDLVASKRNDGIFLTVLGFGMGNLKDNRMEQLADKGNGNYAYVDDIAEARKVFVSEFGGTLFTVAKDVKLQVEFNPSTVQAYRLIGYENRVLAKEDFENDAKDAGEIGAGHTVTALYEIVPVGVRLDVDMGSTPPLKYQNVPLEPNRRHRSELMTVSIRYKEPDGSKSRLIQASVPARVAAGSADARFTMAVAAYGMLLHRSPHVGTFTYDAVLELANSGLGEDREHYRADFVQLVTQTRFIAHRVANQKQP